MSTEALTAMPPPPSSVNVMTVPSLLNTLGKAEAEQLAAVIVRALAVNGDTWRPIGWPEVAAVIKADIAAGRGPWERLLKNPFYVPSPVALLKERKGPDGQPVRFAEWVDGAGGLLQFTPAGICRLTRLRGGPRGA